MIVVAGFLLALTAVLLVLEPVLRAAAGKPVEMAVPLFVDSDDDDDPLQRRRDRALAALREIEFDRATGKLSDEDFQRMHAAYEVEALDALRAVDVAAEQRSVPAAQVALASGGLSDEDAIERLIAEARASARDKKRRFCAECGTALEGSGRFCVECGTAVAV